MEGSNDKSSSGSSSEEQTVTEKKFGGIAPKKPLISKDHERAYFDSADWVLGKQAANHSAQAAIESLKPKLKRVALWCNASKQAALLLACRERPITSFPLASRPVPPAKCSKDRDYWSS